MTVDLFEHYWKLAGIEEPLFDEDRTSVVTWAEGYFKCSGMVRKDTGEPHGIVRKVHKNYIMEGTYYEGKQWGLNRSVRQNVTVAQYKNGVSQAYFRFDD